MAKKKVASPEANDTKFVVARLDDGTLQLNLTIPFEEVQNVRELVTKKLIEDLEIPGFRKGKAPTDVAIKHIDKQRIYETTLQNLLPEHYSKAVVSFSLNPILAPRFELISVEEDRDWQVRAITCETPIVSLGEYKEKIKGELAKASIWVPGRDSDKKQVTGNKGDGDLSPEEKEQAVIKVLLEEAQVKVAKPLIEEEINHKLSQLLEQVQKLGLSIEQYLSSTGKTVEQLRGEYAQQSLESLKIVLALNKIAQDEKITIEEKDVQEVLSATNLATSDQKGSLDQRDIESQKRMIHSVLLRRKTLEYLASL